MYEYKSSCACAYVINLITLQQTFNVRWKSIFKVFHVHNGLDMPYKYLIYSPFMSDQCGAVGKLMWPETEGDKLICRGQKHKRTR